ncbi:hypothetical protein [Devosia neptuniae]|uniref:hypothetical protein n=2 Tax=Devosia TaxID=46913 RepID=UPI0022AEC0DD|nr:hypothetical protein [Devosia neptuniae]
MRKMLVEQIMNQWCGCSMAFEANVVSLMIASPGDVLEERNQVRDVVHEWNDLNAKERRMVLLPVGWETHSSPLLGARPQQLINERVLDGCDLLVGVFWTRLGTPTGDSPSGTVEEIQRHLDAGKPAMVYFSTAPVAPQSIDQDQFSALMKFREWCQEKGLIETYDNLADFREKFRRQIQIELRDNAYLKALEPKQSEDSTAVALVEFQDTSIESRLNSEARQLLKAASEDREGTIIHARYLSGQAIQTNGINFADSDDRRSVARWEAAIDQLKSLDLIVDRGYKGEIFKITALGYEVADRLPN